MTNPITRAWQWLTQPTTVDPGPDSVVPLARMSGPQQTREMLALLQSEGINATTKLVSTRGDGSLLFVAGAYDHQTPTQFNGSIGDGVADANLVLVLGKDLARSQELLAEYRRDFADYEASLENVETQPHD